MAEISRAWTEQRGVGSSQSLQAISGERSLRSDVSSVTFAGAEWAHKQSATGSEGGGGEGGGDGGGRPT